MEKDTAARVMPPLEKPAAPEKPPVPAPLKPAPAKTPAAPNLERPVVKPPPPRALPEKTAPEKPAPAIARKEPEDKKKSPIDKEATGDDHAKQDSPGRKT